MNTEISFDYCHFLREAYNEYTHYVKSGKKTYHRFCVDYLNGHKMPLPCEDFNEHERIMGSIDELLTLRQSLVENYFIREILTDHNFDELKTAHESTDTGHHPIEKEAKRTAFQANADRTAKHRQTASLDINMDEKQMDMIANVMNGNEEGLVKLVPDQINGDDVFLFLKGKKALNVMKGQNYKILLLLDAMAVHNLIGKCWEKFMTFHESLISYNNNQPMTNNQMWRNLSEGKKKHGDLYKKYLEIALEIANNRARNDAQWM